VGHAGAVDTVHATAEQIARLVAAHRPEPPDCEAVRSHLVEGCPSCWEMFWTFRRERAPVFAPDGLLVPTHVPRPADKRAGVLADHQLVCGAGDYELDVIVRELEGPQRLDIGGQVTQAESLHDPARHVPLRLLEAKGRVVVAETKTDEFGEFDFSAKPGPRYGLLVGERRDAPCVLVWDGDL
jgi:hypothetical protein